MRRIGNTSQHSCRAHVRKSFLQFIDHFLEITQTVSARMAEVTYILDDLDYYSEAYKTFTRCSAKTGAIEDWIEGSFDEIIVQKLTARVKPDGALKVLGLGSGAGNVDCAMLEKLHPHFPRIDNTVVEPSEAQVDLFKALIQKKGDALKGSTFSWKLQTSDDYLDGVFQGGAVPSEKFHLITAVHVVYYASDLKQTLQRLHDMLEEGGLLFIIILSRDSTIIKVHRKMNEVVPDMRRLLLTDGQLGEALDEVGLKYSAQQITRYIQGTAIFKDDTSQEGNHLLDFLTHSKDFRKTAPETLRDTILNYLKDPQCSEAKDDEMLVFRHWVHVTIPK